ncbi:MAG: hypothetical protein GY832_26400 [Chloroflexi bacterium]|nr:hypothetical protein [Chloroflexota bacterium]
MLNKMTRITFVALIILIAVQGIGLADAPDPARPPIHNLDDDDDLTYLEAIQNTSAMVWDENARNLISAHGLDIMNVTWEDTGRYYGSSVGPNISDVTIQVEYLDPHTEISQLTLMPVIRYPNFADLTADISPDHFYLLVGNENGDELERVTLTEYLGNIRRYLTDGDSWAGDEGSLLAERDSHVLVSAQAAFLPVPRQDQAQFNPVLFNYQSRAGDPAVLTVVATREGTSATIIDNVRDAFPSGFSWGQRLFFNQNGERASFTGERLSDFQAENRDDVGDSGSGDVAPEAAGESGLNMVLLIQVPLKQKQPMAFEYAVEEGAVEAPSEAVLGDTEAAVIGHGKVEGPFTEIDGIEIERDDQFPIRVTVQFYKATSTGVLTAADVEEIAAQIQRVYEDADYVGSLVVDGQSERPTEYDGSKIEPADWWQVFWEQFESEIGISRDEAREILRSLKVDAGRREILVNKNSDQ